MQKNMKRYLPVAIFILVILIIAIIAFIATDKGTSATANGNGGTSSQKTETPIENSDPIENINRQWTKGNPDGKIKITEYSDFQCPFCKKGNDTIDEIYKKHEGNISLTFVHFPLTSIHPYSLPAAKAAEAAGYQGKFWEMHDLLFANQNNLTPADLETYARKLDLNIEEFNRYMNNTNIANKITGSLESLSKMEFDEIALDDKGNIISKGKTKIEGTPAFLINGKLVVGAYPADQFEIFIKEALNSK